MKSGAVRLCYECDEKPSLLQVCDAWQQVLEEYFERASVRVGPNALFGGRLEVADVGSVQNLLEKKTAACSLSRVAQLLHRPDALMWGAGLTRFEGGYAEYAPHQDCCGGENNSHHARHVGEGEWVAGRTHDDTFYNLCNLALADRGGNGDDDGNNAIHVSCSGRKKRQGSGVDDDQSVIDLLASALKAHFTPPVSVAGIFQVVRGTIKSHVVLNEYPCIFGHVRDFTRFYHVEAPITCLSVFHSKPIPGMDDLNMQHTHFYGDGGKGGHYHGDEGSVVEYSGTFALAERVTKIDLA